VQIISCGYGLDGAAHGLACKQQPYVTGQCSSQPQGAYTGTIRTGMGRKPGLGAVLVCGQMLLMLIVGSEV
jgi:hypothetical protein